MRLQTRRYGFLSPLISFSMLAKISIVTIIACVATITSLGRPEAGAQDQQKKLLLKIVDPRTPRYNYDRLTSSKNTEQIRVTVRNLEPTGLELVGSIEVQGLVDMNDKKVELILQEVNPSEIAPSTKKELIFKLLPSPIALRPGNYKGEIKLTPTTIDKSPITVPLTLVVDPSVEIVDQKQSYDYLDLLLDGYPSVVAATFRNKRNTTLSIKKATLEGQKNILSSEGKPVNLEFKPVNPDEEGKLLPSHEGPMEIPGGGAVNVYFKLQHPGFHPASGEYKAYLVVIADNESRIEPKNPLSIYVPSKDRVEAKTDIMVVKAWLLQYPKGWSKRWSSSWLGRKLGLGSVFWNVSFYVFLLIVLVIIKKLWFRIVLYFRRYHLGTIAIETLTDATTEANLKPDGLKALLKDTLENLGLAPPKPQPAASITTDVTNIITKSAVQETGIISALKEAMIFLWSIVWPCIGHKTAITFRSSTNASIEAIVEIKNALTDRIEEIKAGIFAKSSDEAVRKVACFIYMHEINQKHILKHMPEWARFTSAESFEFYQDGQDKQAKGKPQEAIVAYRKAAGLQFDNALIRLSICAALVDDGKYMNGLEEYLAVVTRWPELLEPRYRLAATFSFSNQLVNEWKTSTRDDKKRFCKSYENYIKSKKDNGPKKGGPPTLPNEFKPLTGDDKAKFRNLLKDYFDITIKGKKQKLPTDEWKALSGDDEVKFRKSLKDYFDSKKGGEPKFRKFKLLKDYIDMTKKDKKGILPTLPEVPEKPNEEFFLQLAEHQWKYLQQQLRWRSRFKEWLVTLNPFDWRADKRSYFRAFSKMWPRGSKRRQYQREVEVATSCTFIRKKILSMKNVDEKLEKKLKEELKEAVKKVKKIVFPKFRLWRRSRWGGRTWRVRYNAACAYSIALTSLQGPMKSETEEEAVKLLKAVIRDPSSADIREWILDEEKGDPDLRNLRKSSAFISWTKFGTPAVEPSPGEQLPDSIAQGWELVWKGASIRRQRWEAHKKALSLWPTHLGKEHLSEVQKWYQSEADIWTAVLLLAMNYGENHQHQPFWDELMRDMEQGQEKPLPALSKKIDAAKIITFKRRWHQLGDRVKELQEKWDHLEDKIRSPIGTPDHSKEGISKRVEAALEAWHALEPWAKYPLNKASQDSFLSAKGF